MVGRASGDQRHDQSRRRVISRSLPVQGCQRHDAGTLGNTLWPGKGVKGVKGVAASSRAHPRACARGVLENMTPLTPFPARSVFR